MTRSAPAGRGGYAAAMQRVRAAIVLVVIALVAVSSAAASNGDPKRAITKVDQERARSVLLRQVDLGAGFVSRPPGPDDLPPGVRCGALSESDLTVTGDATSRDFQLDRPGTLLTIGSTAQVYRSLREADASWSRAGRPGALTCLSDIVRKSGQRGQRVEVLSAKRLAFPRVSQKTMAFRIVARVRSGATAVKVYFDAILLQQGRLQAGVVFTSALQPVGATDQAALAGVVGARMAKAASASGGSDPIA